MAYKLLLVENKCFKAVTGIYLLSDRSMSVNLPQNNFQKLMCINIFSLLPTLPFPLYLCGTPVITILSGIKQLSQTILTGEGPRDIDCINTRYTI